MAQFVQSYALHVVDRGGRTIDLRQWLASDVIAFYFSAQWCHPSRHFTPLLRKFTETLTSFGDSSLKIIFVSSDKTEHDMWKYFYDCHGDWFALAFTCRDGKERLERQYQVSGLPQLVVIDPIGRQAVRDARGEVWAAVGGTGGGSSTQVLTTYMGWRTASQAAAPGSCSAPPLRGAVTAPHELPTGVRVKVRGLTGAQELNGAEGRIHSYDASKQRFVVELAEKNVSLRAANLLQLLPVRFRCPDRPEDWIDADIVDYDDETCDLLFQVSDGGFKCEDDGANVGSEVQKTDSMDVSQAGTAPRRGKLGDASGPVLKPGARVLVHSLQAESAKQWNNRVAEVLQFDEEGGRYLVRVAVDAQLKVRASNIRLCPLGPLPTAGAAAAADPQAAATEAAANDESNRAPTT